MSIFDGVIALTIDEGDVVKIEKDTSNVELKGTGINADGTLYNGCGYKAGVRMSSSGGETEGANFCVTGYIPYRGGRVVVSGSKDNVPAGGQYFMAYDENFNWLQHHSISALVAGGFASYGLQEDGFYGFELTSIPADWAGMAYFRTSIHGDTDDLSVKIKNIETLWEKPASYTNQVTISKDANGNIYNGVGYKNGYRIRSGGVEAEASDATCTGFIPFKKGDILRIYPAFVERNTNNAINFADASFTNLGQITDSGASYGVCQYKLSIYDSVVVDGVSTLTYSDDFDANIAYVRITNSILSSSDISSGSEMIITINEEIEMYGALTNFVAISTDTDGSIYNGTGYKENIRLSSSGGISESAQDGSVTTGFMPWYGVSTVMRIKGVEWITTASITSQHYYYSFYDANKTFLNYMASYGVANNEHIMTVTRDANGIETTTFNTGYGTENAFLNDVRKAKYIRITAKGRGEDMVVTMNQEIKV